MEIRDLTEKYSDLPDDAESLLSAAFPAVGLTQLSYVA